MNTARYSYMTDGMDFIPALPFFPNGCILQARFSGKRGEGRMKRFNIGYVCIVLCALIFSAVEVVLKHTAGTFHPMQITVLRFLIGGAVLLPGILARRRKKGEA